MSRSQEVTALLGDDDNAEEQEQLTLQRSRQGYNSNSHSNTSHSNSNDTNISKHKIRTATDNTTTGNIQWSEGYQSSSSAVKHLDGLSIDKDKEEEEDDGDGDGDGDADRASPYSSLRLCVYLVLSVFCAAANSITWKRTLNRFRAHDGSADNMEFFVTQWTILLYVILAAIILAYRWLFTNLITEQQRQYPQSKFMLMGLMDGIAGLSSSLGGAFTSGQVQTIINQINIPVTMLLSSAFLNSRYHTSQYCGAALIVAGSLIAAGASLSSGTASDTSSLLWYGPLILIIATVPNSFSNVYKEHNFKRDGLDVYFLTTNVSLYQVLLGFLFCPILALPGLGGLAMNEIPHNFSDGWSCFCGEHLRGYDCHVAPYPYVILLLYVLVNFFYNVLLLLITKHGSALLLVIAAAISLPITNAVFTLPLVMGVEAESWSWMNCIGLVVVVVGFLLYSIVNDPQTGDIVVSAQGPPGQMIYITEENVAKSQLTHPHTQQGPHKHRRRHSFDVASSPIVIANAQQKRHAAHQQWMQANRGIQEGSTDSRIFFTPPALNPQQTVHLYTM